MNTLTRDRAHQLMTDVAALLPFPADTADLGGGFTLQIDLGVHPTMSDDPDDDLPHDRAGIDHAGLAEEVGMVDQDPVWWFETYPDGIDQQTYSTLGPDAPLADVAAWIAEQARAAGSPAAVDPAQRPVAPAQQAGKRYMERRIAEKVRARLDQTEGALRAMFEHGVLKENGHEVWTTGEHRRRPSDTFRANAPFTHAVCVRTRTTTPEGRGMLSESQAAVFAHEDPNRPILTVEFYTPRKGAHSVPYVRTRHYKTADGAAKAIEEHLAHLVEAGLHTEAGRPLRMVSSQRADG